MTLVQSLDVKALIRFYEKRGWDWGLPAEFLLRKYNQSPPCHVVKTAVGVGRGRPRNERP